MCIKMWGLSLFPKMQIDASNRCLQHHHWAALYLGQCPTLQKGNRMIITPVAKVWRGQQSQEWIIEAISWGKKKKERKKQCYVDKTAQDYTKICQGELSSWLLWGITSQPAPWHPVGEGNGSFWGLWSTKHPKSPNILLQLGMENR